ncbi:Collagen triple helix repeat [uncultured Caudovirales phage]|uniref:Collagen triple helix repeat n=1 Tax=uncultured Caudovirales phage TaxID=2100421 RepID=A0A6J5MSX7_9CAUD|nr:Collagen triple helix repeat [uncultured Caudovirales phage]
MSQPPAPFDRSWSFTDFSQSNPTTPHQGQKIDQELNNARTAINSTISRLGEIQADDGKVRTTALNLAVIAEEVEPLLTDAPVQAVEAAGAQQVGLVNDAGDAKVAELEAVLTSQNALDAIAAKDDAVDAAGVADAFANSATNSAIAAQGYANTALQAKNSAQVHAQVAVDAANSIPLIVGPVGPAGPQGQQGVPGVAGQTGPAGQQGVQGIQGIQGIQGVPGVVSASAPLYYDDGTQNISIDLGGYATESWVNGQGFASQSDWRLTAVASSSFINLAVAATSGLFNFTYYDGYAGSDVTIQLEIQSPVDGTNYNGYSVGFDTTQPNGYWQVVGSSVVIGLSGYSNMQEALNALSSGSGSGGWKLIGSGSPYADASVLSGAGRTVYNVPITAQPGDSLVLRQGLFSNLTETIKGFNWNDYLIGTTANGILTGYAKSGFLTAGDAATFALKSGTTFTGKVNFAPGSTISPINIGSGSSPSSSVAGDIWMGTNTISYKDGANLVRTITANGLTNTFSAPQIIDTTATTPALRVTQKGTGNVLLVEDALNPDTTALVVEQSGNVGIGVATGFTATAKLEVVGNTKSTTLSTGAGPTFSVNSTTTHNGGSDTLDLLITVNGVNYRIGLRPA